MNWEKHEGSLLLVSSDGSSILPASTTIPFPTTFDSASLLATGAAGFAAEAAVQSDGHKTCASRVFHTESEAG